MYRHLSNAAQYRLPSCPVPTPSALQDTQLGAGSTVTATMADGGKKASKAFGNAWRGAAAYHYYILAQRQFYAGEVHTLVCVRLYAVSMFLTPGLWSRMFV